MKIDNNINFTHRGINLLGTDNGVIVDGTCGNGNDTLYLATTFPNSQIYAFDIQSSAIAKTKQRCQHLSNIKYIEKSHEYVDEYVNKINLAVFNLGYLPGADNNLTTKAESTIKAIEKILDLLVVGGGIVITLYRGAGNISESLAVTEYLKNINKDKFIVCQYDLINLSNNPYNIIVECKY